MKSFFFLTYLLFFSLLSGSIGAQPFEKGSKFNRLSVGVSGVHFYDVLNSGQQINERGFPVLDMKGMNGDKTKFDKGLSLDLSYVLSPIVSFDLNYTAGGMTGADTALIEYYNSNLDVLGVGLNVALKSSRTLVYKWIPYLRFSGNRTQFNSTRYFVADDVRNTLSSDNGVRGSVASFGLGLGCRYHFSDNIHVFLQSEYVTANTNSLDGYASGSGRDQFVMSRIGLRYSLGKNRHRDRSAAWQGVVTREEMTEMKNDNSKSFNNLSSALSDVVGRVDVNGQKIEAVDKSLSMLSSDTKNRFDELDAKKRAVEEAIGVSLPVNVQIYFDLASSKIRPDQLLALNSVVDLLRKDPSLKITLIPFTDRRGTSLLNSALRSKRARSVVSSIQKSGIDPTRLVIGDWPGSYSESFERDRRVEIGFSK